MQALERKPVRAALPCTTGKKPVFPPLPVVRIRDAKTEDAGRLFYGNHTKNW